MKKKAWFLGAGALILLGVGCQPFVSNVAPTEKSSATAPYAAPAAPIVPAIDISQRLTFDRNGYHGMVQARGYLKIIYSEGACDESTGPDCGTYNYAMFYIDETNNLDLLNFIYSRLGSKFLDQRMVGLGCLKPKKEIYYYNSGKIGQAPDGYITGKDLAKLEESNAKNLVVLQMTKPVGEQGAESNDCFSFFRDFKVIDTFDPPNPSY